MMIQSLASSMSDRHMDIADLQGALHRAALKAQQLDVRAYEFQSREQVRREVVPSVDAAVDQALDALEQVLERYDAPSAAMGPEDSGMFDLAFDALVEPSTPVHPVHDQRVADASFMARWELQRKRAMLAVAEERDDANTLLSHCCSTRRRVIKATAGVEQVLSQIEGRPSVFDGLYRTELQTAVETRAAYYTFVSTLRRASEREVMTAIRLAGTIIATLIGRDIYERLRVEDRLELRCLQRRFRQWVLDSRDPQEGLRLMSDASAFGSLLMEVNRRAVLVEHDRELLGRILTGLRRRSVDDGLVAALRTLRGRDPDLDMLIEGSAAMLPELWEPTVSRVLEQLAEPEARGGSDEHDAPIGAF